MAMNFPNSPTIGQTYSAGVGSPTYVWTGSVWINIAAGGGGQPVAFTATAGQTVFTVAYQVGAVEVYQNGAKLVIGDDFTATNGTSITLASGATAGDSFEVVPYGVITTLDGLLKAQNLADLPSKATARANLGVGQLSQNLADLPDKAAARASLELWGKVISDQTLQANATQFTDIALAGFSEFRFSLTALANSGAASNFSLVAAFSFDGGATFPAGASEYTRLTENVNGSAVSPGFGNSTTMLLSGAVDKATPAIAARVHGNFWPGTAAQRTHLFAHSLAFDNTNLNKVDIDNIRTSVGAATHIRFFANVASALGIGSRLIVEGRP